MEWLIRGMMVVCILAIVIVLLHPPKSSFDDSDVYPNRSGFTVMRDAKTGCEYLSTFGAVTLRMNVNGKQEGCR